VAVNPEPDRFDGILLPFLPNQAREAVERVMEERAKIRDITLAQVRLGDGQQLLAFNDFFLGARSHISALYQITCGQKSEIQSSSGVLVSTGAGSTGWVSSAFNMAAGVSRFCGGPTVTPVRMPWEDRRLLFVVREPFVSRHSQAGIVAGILQTGEELTIESRMPSYGVIFSDGMEADFLQFNSGAIAHVRAAEQSARLVVS
jgi:hypothetical protein